MGFANIEVSNIEDEGVHRAVEEILARVNLIGTGPLNNGSLVTDVDLSTSSLKVPHKLGRKPTGYLITKRSANAIVYGDTLSDRFLTLTASATVTVDIWVF